MEDAILIWENTWDQALAIWTNYARLQKPVICTTPDEEKKEAIGQGLAMIRLNDLRVVISMKNIINMGLQDYPLEILAHEIGHHICCPADLNDLARLTARVQKGLMDLAKNAPMILNLYTDLLVNHHLKTECKLPMEKIYLTISQTTENSLWAFYMRVYEILWALPKASLAKCEISDETEADAQLANRIIKNSGKYWIKGAGQFAVLCYSYLARDSQKTLPLFMKGLLDTMDAGSGDVFPEGILEIDEDETGEIKHPAYELDDNFDKKTYQEQGSKGNYREPFQFGQILEAMGVKADSETMAMAYYKQRALPYLIPFPRETQQSHSDPLPEGLNTWDAGSPFSQIDWFESISRSPVLIPGYTLFEREYGETQGSNPEILPVDLDLYIDSSGSMPNPMVNISYLTLAGAIVALSALRSGSRVQATLWSGVHQVIKTEGFVR
ncbi:MAG: hypothetical protein JXR70_05460, partial [Spirochaetales bacterium]|nr:hypothetical protein [Spirochaetales bacterium]